MTHSELLLELFSYRVKSAGYSDSHEPHAIIKALEAVVELHRPEEQDHKQYEKCWNCDLLYPCPTIRLIEKELA